MLNKEKQVEVIFNKQKCTNCGLCAKVCPSEFLIFQNNEIKINEDNLFGCIQCGHCMMACPNDSIIIRGEGICENDVFELDKNLADYDRLYSLFSKRRSARKFKNQTVSQEIIDKILQAASTGAISIPPYEVKVLVINGYNKVQEFADDVVISLEKMLKIINPFTLALFRPLIGNTNCKLFKDFVIPLIKLTVESRKKGEDLLFYNAPALILFYTTELADKEDSIISSTLAATAAETLGLGSCIIGTVPPAINNNKKLKQKYGIGKNEKAAMAFILGYPETVFSKGIKRRFKEVRYY